MISSFGSLYGQINVKGKGGNVLANGSMKYAFGIGEGSECFKNDMIFVFVYIKYQKFRLLLGLMVEFDLLMQ